MHHVSNVTEVESDFEYIIVTIGKLVRELETQRLMPVLVRIPDRLFGSFNRKHSGHNKILGLDFLFWSEPFFQVETDTRYGRFTRGY